MNKVNFDSIVFSTDSYKVSHWLQFVPGTKKSFYYIEARGGIDAVLFFGLQAIIKKVLSDIPSEEDINAAKLFWESHGVPYFNTKGWNNLRKLGYYPVRIKAVKEGGIFKTKSVLVTIESTVDGFEWLPGWLETLLLQVWYPITVATRINECKKVIYDNLVKTGTPESIDFKLHSFGYRGVSSKESAGIGSMAELVSFKGTDTIAGVIAAREYYNSSDMLGFSIPAAEHSTITSWGIDGEFDAYKNMLDKFAKPGSIVAVVSDSYDLNTAIKNGWCGKLKQQIIDSGATVVIRPDSGDPTTVVLRTINQLADGFGFTYNEKGYKVLNYVRVIQGDGIDGPSTIVDILKALEDEKWSGDNIAFGMGGGSLQHVNRDTYKFAMKCSAVFVEGVWKDVYKCPVDAPWKSSKKGILDSEDLQVVYENGKFVKEYTFEEVRKNASFQFGG